MIAAVARVGLEIAPDDPALIRIQRRARARIAAAHRTGCRGRTRTGRLQGALTRTGLRTAYLHLGRAVSARPHAERDALRVRTLLEAIEDVRDHVEPDAVVSQRWARGVPVRADVGS